MSDTAIEKILKVLAEDIFSIPEIMQRTGLPKGTVTATLSQLKHMGLVDRVVPLKRGVPYGITEIGRDYLRARREKE